MNASLRAWAGRGVLSLAVCLPFGAAALSGGGVTDFLRQSMPGAADPVGFVTNGRMAVSLDAAGTPVSVVWPGAGGPEHAADSRAARWGVDLGGGVSWLDAADWRAERVETSGTAGETVWRRDGVEARQRITVPAGMDGFVAELRVSGAAAPGGIVWEQTLLPCTAAPGGLPLAAPPFDAARGFAGGVFADGRGAFVFRPALLSPGDRERARDLAARGAREAAWDVFEGGVWIAAGALGRMTARFPDAADGGTAAGAAARRVELQIVPAPDGESWTAVVAVAFGGGRGAAKETLRALLDRPFAEWAAAASADTAGGAAFERLRASWDEMRGSVVFAPCGHPPLAVTTPELCACAALAFGRSGVPEKAERLLAFLLGLARREEGKRAPAGSLPALVHADGAPAFPGAVVNASDTAWCLLALRDVTAAWPAEKRGAFLAEHRADVAVLADFLTRWTDLATGAPLPAFDWGLLRGVSSFENTLTGLLGIGAACDLAALSGGAPPREWTDWRRSLEAQVRFALANAPASVVMSPALAAWVSVTGADALPPGFRGALGGGQTFADAAELGEAARRSLGDGKPQDALMAALGVLLAG